MEHRRTTPFHPQSNGRIERANRTLKSMLRKLIKCDTRADWEEQLAHALWALRTNVSTVHGHSPFLLHHSRPCRVPVSDLLSGDSEFTFENRLQLASEVFQEVAEATKHSRQYNKERLRNKANAKDISVGDSVILCANEPLSLTARWDYGYLVTEVRGLTVSLFHPESGARLQVHREKVKLVDPDLPWEQISPRPRRTRIQQQRQPRRRDSLPRVSSYHPVIPQVPFQQPSSSPSPSSNQEHSRGDKRSRTFSDSEPSTSKRILRSYKRSAEEAGCSNPPAKQPRTWDQLNLQEFVSCFLSSISSPLPLKGYYTSHPCPKDCCTAPRL